MIEISSAKTEEGANIPTSTTVVKKKKGGRPKGSLNKKTIARMEQEAKDAAERAARGEPPRQKGKRGRPKGSLNKKTIERMQREQHSN